MKKGTPEEMIIECVKEKSVVKQDVFANTKTIFKQLQEVLEERSKSLRDQINAIDDRLKLNYKSSGPYEAEFTIAGDRLIFHMHTNVFKLDSDNNLWKTSYLKENDMRAYCGIINIYNFLNDSFLYNRHLDSGYLIARIFVNHEGHFFVQGKRQLGFLYNDFIHSVLDVDALNSILDSALLYTLDFDLLTPPYQNVQEVSVGEMTQISNNLQLKTGKRLGFKFQADTDEFE
jgi:hypothetical protein